MKITCALVSLILITTALISYPIAAAAHTVRDGGSCTVDSGSGAFTGTAGIWVAGECDPLSGAGISTGPQAKYIECGIPSSKDNGFWDKRCGAPKTCLDPDPKAAPHSLIAAWATLIQQNGRWVLQSVWCPATTDPIPTTEALRQQVLRLLPAVAIGSAWTTRALVNAEAIFWAETDANRSLPTATVVGRNVELRIAFDHADWNFGDGATDTTTDPGTPYTDSNPCDTAQCPGYYGHTYTDTGPVAITLTVAWNAQFSLDGGTTWTDVDAVALTGPETRHPLDVVQARGILVTDPNR